MAKKCWLKLSVHFATKNKVSALKERSDNFYLVLMKFVCDFTGNMDWNDNWSGDSNSSTYFLDMENKLGGSGK